MRCSAVLAHVGFAAVTTFVSSCASGSFRSREAQDERALKFTPDASRVSTARAPMINVAESEPAVAPKRTPSASSTCGTSEWNTYGHDATRSSASDGCAYGPYELQWTFRPLPFKGRRSTIFHALATSDGVYASGLRGESPVLHRIDSRGAEVWAFDTRADIHRPEWATITNRAVVFNNDGLYFIDRASGKGKTIFLDSWGPTLEDGDRIVMTSALQVEGPSLFVGAFDSNGAPLWRGDKLAAYEMFGDDSGGIAAAGGVVVHAANYKKYKPSSLSSFDAQTGKLFKSVALDPLSSPSISPFGSPVAQTRRVFLVERAAGGIETLVARSLPDLSLVWSAQLHNAPNVPPVVARGRVFIHEQSAVRAFDEASGHEVWSVPIARDLPPVAYSTSIAAALGSDTLIVASGSRVVTLSLSTGRELSITSIPGTNRVHSPVVRDRDLVVVADGSLVYLRGQNEPTDAIAHR